MEGYITIFIYGSTITDHKRQSFSMEGQITSFFNGSTITEYRETIFSMEGHITILSMEAQSQITSSAHLTRVPVELKQFKHPTHKLKAKA